MSASSDTSVTWMNTPSGWECMPSLPVPSPWVFSDERDWRDVDSVLPPPAPLPLATPGKRSAVRSVSSLARIPSPPIAWLAYWLCGKSRFAFMLAACFWLVWSQGIASAGSFSLNPGDILVADYGADLVLKIDGATGSTRNLGAFSSPTDVALGNDGQLYVAEFGGSIYRLNLNNGEKMLLKAPTDEEGFYDALWGMVIGPTGDLIVTRGYDDAIVKVDRVTGAEQIISQTNSLFGVCGLALLDADHIIVCSTFSDEVVKVALEGGAQTPVTTLGGGIDKPRGIAVHGTNLFVTALDSRQIRRVPVAGGTVDTFYTAGSSLFGMECQSNGDLLAGSDQPPYKVLRIGPGGNLMRTFTDSLFSEITGMDISRISLVATDLVNTAPILDPIPDVTIDTEELLSFIAWATDTNWPPQEITFSLDADAPSGATISANGVFSWTPTPAHGSGNFVIKVIASDDDTTPLSVTNAFTVTVIGPFVTNTAPTIPAIASRSVFEGDVLSLELVAEDSDVPAQVLTFDLLAGAPTGMTISDGNVLHWVPTDIDGPGSHVIQVKVTDNGVPPLSATTSFTVTVNELYLQSAASPGGPYLDELTAVIDKAAGTGRVSRAPADAQFYRLRCNLPFRFESIHLTDTEVQFQYQLQ